MFSPAGARVLTRQILPYDVNPFSLQIQRAAQGSQQAEGRWHGTAIQQNVQLFRA
jgi:hypothetical protein